MWTLGIYEPFTVGLHRIFPWSIRDDPASGIKQFPSFAFSTVVMVWRVESGWIWRHRFRPEKEDQPQGTPENRPNIRGRRPPIIVVVAMGREVLLVRFAFIPQPESHFIF